MNDIARIANWEGRSDKRRLLLKVSDELKRIINEMNPYMVAINLENGDVAAFWDSENGVRQFSDQYKDVRRVD